MAQDFVYNPPTGSAPPMDRGVLAIIASRFLCHRLSLHSSTSSRTMRDAYFLTIKDFICTILQDVKHGEDALFGALIIFERMRFLRPEFFYLKSRYFVPMAKFFFISAYVIAVNTLAEADTPQDSEDDRRGLLERYMRRRKNIWDSALLFDVYDQFFIDILIPSNEDSVLAILDGDLSIAQKMLSAFKKKLIQDFGGRTRLQYPTYTRSFVMGRLVFLQGPRTHGFTSITRHPSPFALDL